MAGGFPGTTFTSPLPIPNSLGLVGVQLFTQGPVLNASVPNAFQGLTSNGVSLTIGGN